MRMLSKFIAATLTVASFATVAHAESAPKQRFTHEGYTYVYEVKDTKTGKMISGRRFPDAVAFNLSVKNGRVSGVSGGQKVTFDLDDARGAASN